jgi:DNA polymerase V
MPITPLSPSSVETELALPLFLTRVPAGFPSPADDFVENKLDLNTYLVQHPAATFFCRVTGHSMRGLGIFDGDLLVVDRALSPQDQDVVLAAIDGELTCKQLDKTHRQLVSANPDYPPIAIKEEMDVVIEGVVTYSIKAHRVRTR